MAKGGKIYRSLSNSNLVRRETFFQPKLTVGPSDDVFEKEADAVADKVMRTQEDHHVQPKHSISSIQRKVAGHEQHTAPSIVGDAVNSSGGKKLDKNTRSFMEGHFGYDFSHVRIHDDTISAKSAQSINALAYTSGNHIVFNEGQYAPHTGIGRRLLAHELTHTIQQGKSSRTMVQRDEDPRIAEIRERLRNGGTLTEEDIAYIKQQIGQQLVNQLLAQQEAARILIDYDSSRPPEDLHRKFHGRLDLKLSGIYYATARSLEGTATSDIDLDAIVREERGTVTMSPPTEDNRLAAMIRQLLFPNNNVTFYDFEFPKEYFTYANAVSLIGSLTVSLSGTDTEATAGMIKVHSDRIPNGVELIMTLSSTARQEGVRDVEREVPGNHWMLTPNPRLFGALGYSGIGGSPAFSTMIGADFPLAYDTSNPLIYLGLGARGTFGSNISGSVGGTVFTGLNFDPLFLQAGFGTGAAFLPEPILTSDGPAQVLLYHELEGMAAYRPIPNLELLLMLSVGGGKDLPAYGSAHLGAGYHF